MALIKCPECGRDNVSNTAEMCPDCGYGIRLHFEKIEREKHQEELRIITLRLFIKIKAISCILMLIKP